MERQPAHRAMNKCEVHFPNGNRAQMVTSPPGTPAIDLLHALDIRQPKALIMIVGGASNMSEQLYPNLVQLFAHGVAHVAISVGAMIIDGGTQTGVMMMMGQGVAEQQHRSTLLGVAPTGRVTYPSKPPQVGDDERIPLDPNHSHFVLVEVGKFGDETETMYGLAAVLSIACPSVAVLINGGPIAEEEVLHNVRQGRPIIVIEGSGRLADDVARLWRGKPSSIPDAKMAEIITQGDLHLFPLTGSPTELVQLTLRLLGGQLW